MYILDAKAPERARLDIFERVNSGEPLTRQQMRNALYNGPATIWLKKAAECDAFRSATGMTLDVKKMRDREAINRFCAFKLLGWKNYNTGDMDDFLAKGLKELNQLTDKEQDQLFRRFELAMIVNRDLFKEHAFRKSLAYNNTQQNRSMINISLFEVCAVTMSILSMPIEEGLLNQIKSDIISLLHDDDFAKAITYSTNSTAAVRKRFASMEEVINKVVAQ